MSRNGAGGPHCWKSGVRASVPGLSLLSKHGVGPDDIELECGGHNGRRWKKILPTWLGIFTVTEILYHRKIKVVGLESVEYYFI
jgi:hypothetical protein